MKKFTSILLSLIFLFNFIFPSIVFALDNYTWVYEESGKQIQCFSNTSGQSCTNVKLPGSTTTSSVCPGEKQCSDYKKTKNNIGSCSFKVCNAFVQTSQEGDPTKNNATYSFTDTINGNIQSQGIYATKSICNTALSEYKIKNPKNTPSDCHLSSEDPVTIIEPGKVGSEVSKVYTLLAPIGNFKTFSSNNIGEYLNTMFKLAIGLCAALAVVMIIFSGIQYMGSESIFGKTEAKSKIFSAILGLLIALGSWVILNTINPDLTGKNGITIDPATSIIPLYDRGSSDPKKANGESVRCTPVLTGPCSVANLTNIFGAANAVAMSKICNMESSGIGGSSTTDYCVPPGKSLPFSFGLFQVNLSASGGLAGSDCVGLFDRAVAGTDAIAPKYNNGFNCKLTATQALYNTCSSRLLNTTTNLAIAKSLLLAHPDKSSWTGDKKFCASAFN